MKRQADSALRTISRIKLSSFLLMLGLSRMLILLAVSAGTHRHEFCNDVAMHMGMLRSPLAVILYKFPQWEQNPVLLPVVEAIFGYPLQLFLSDFVTLRIVMIIWEVLAGWLFFQLVDVLNLEGKRRALCLIAFLVLPTGWITSAVMAQDDPIATCGFLLPLLLFLRGKIKWALVASGIGFVAAKIFVALELLDFIGISKRRDRLVNAAIGISPIMLIYGAVAIHRRLHGYPPPLLGFRPNPHYGTNFWIILRRYAGLNLHYAGVYSGFLALAASLIPVILMLRLHETARMPLKVVAVTGSSLLIFFSLFYHIEPEYFMIVMPALILTADNRGDTICVGLIAAFAWLGKFFQNAAFVDHADVNSGKLVYLHLFKEIFHSSPGVWLTADQIIFSILTIYVSWRWCLKIRRDALHTAVAGVEGSLV